MTLPTLIARLRELEKTATGKGALWAAHHRDDGTAQVYATSVGPCRMVAPVAETLVADASLIVELRNSLLPVLTAYEALLAASVSQQRRIERLEEENAELRNQPKVERRMSEHLTFVEERTS